MNQRVNGGQWNLLGTYSFSSGTNYKVEVSDSPNGKVAADAIYIAAAGAPTGAEFTWTPAIPSSGIYQVYARWPASSVNTGAAQYTVTHGGGTANVTLNQKQNGGSWMPLGSWSFAPGAGHKVTLAASSDGTTIADAMLLVAAGAQPANLLYVHADHLGSPQKLTDASQATVWDGVFDPFGEEVAVTGLAAMPLRFPGQYADEETGFSYNWFRDYDPTMGRYVESDPIGLSGGLNTFAYASLNPVTAVDPFGLKVPCAGTVGCKPPPPPLFFILEHTFDEMEAKNVRGADQFFHCLAACRAKKAGHDVDETRWWMNRKEDFDRVQNWFGLYGGRQLTDQQMQADMNQDKQANEQGLQCPPGNDCNKQCWSLLPGNTHKYMQQYK